ncbi:hypothetical protein AMS68_003752 [Peltaster fructicola]|uniref:Uncharacterized protein n=1 Tax=Peltaster fructicola TaxID=286661 RepID=A0A6H0XUB0_9PEZI|nr:hypothetical protein AMS68_003752 [Peltaster fructicola]
MNVGLSNDEFISGVQQQFDELYRPGDNEGIQTVGDECVHIDAIREGVEEMKSMPFMFLQTPQFTVKSPQLVDSTKLPLLELDLRHGVISDVKLGLPQATTVELIRRELLDQPIHEVVDWAKLLQPQEWDDDHRNLGTQLIAWLQQAFPAFDSS